MAKIRVLVVEDSVTVREQLCDVLMRDLDFELVGAASDGRQAIAMVEELRPDVITMDMMMPIMSGLAATEYIMAHLPTPILVVSSSFNRGELFKMYDALSAGAVDVMEKPSGEEAEGEWERRFLSTLRIVARIRVITHVSGRTKSLNHDALRLASVSGGRASIIAIGASTGGPGAMVEVLRSLPTDINVPVLFVLHINPQFGHAFAEWLGAQTSWRARLAKDGERVDAARGEVLVAPPSRHLLVRDGLLRLDDGPERFSCKPSVDVLFESVAAEYGKGAVGALLTGMGRDGAAGLLAMRNAGGSTIAQDEATSVVYGMPREAVINGGAQRVLPLGEIGRAVGELVKPGRNGK